MHKNERGEGGEWYIQCRKDSGGEWYMKGVRVVNSM